MMRTRILSEEAGQDETAYLTVWLFFQIAAGHIALPILAATMVFVKSGKKSVPLINACVTFIVSAVCSPLLFYAGEQTGPQPNGDLCVGQASLVGAIPILTSTATFIFAYDLWRTYDGHDLHDRSSVKYKRIALSQVVIPYAPFGIFVAIGVTLSLRGPNAVGRVGHFYCSLNSEPLTYVIDIVSTVLCLLALALEVPVVVSSLRYWRIFRRINESISLSFRAFGFTFYLLVSTAINLVANWIPLSVAPDIISATVGMVFFLVFATQKDIVRAWCFWRRPKAVPLLHPHSPSLLVPILPFGNKNPRNIPDTDRSSKNTYASSTLLRDYYESRAQGVEVIGRPEEAFLFVESPVRQNHAQH